MSRLILISQANTVISLRVLQLLHFSQKFCNSQLPTETSGHSAASEVKFCPSSAHTYATYFQSSNQTLFNILVPILSLAAISTHLCSPIAGKIGHGWAFDLSLWKLTKHA